MGELSEQNRALIESALDGFSRAMWDANKHISTSDLNRLLDAARTEGRGEGEPVAWRIRGDGLWAIYHTREDAEAHGKLFLCPFEIQPLYASPIREPEISKATLIKVMRQHIKADATGLAPAVISHYIVGFEEAADAILNLAPVGGRGAVSASDRAFVRHLIREMRSAIADDPNDATITTGPLDPDILERVLNVALGAQEQVGMK